MRIVGLPGETWSMREGFVYVDGRQLPKPYLTAVRRESISYLPHAIPTLLCRARRQPVAFM